MLYKSLYNICEHARPVSCKLRKTHAASCAGRMLGARHTNALVRQHSHAPTQSHANTKVSRFRTVFDGVSSRAQKSDCKSTAQRAGFSSHVTTLLVMSTKTVRERDTLSSKHSASPKLRHIDRKIQSSRKRHTPSTPNEGGSASDEVPKIRRHHARSARQAERATNTNRRTRKDATG